MTHKPIGPSYRYFLATITPSSNPSPRNRDLLALQNHHSVTPLRNPRLSVDGRRSRSGQTYRISRDDQSFGGRRWQGNPQGYQRRGVPKSLPTGSSAVRDLTTCDLRPRDLRPLAYRLRCRLRAPRSKPK